MSSPGGTAPGHAISTVGRRPAPAAGEEKLSDGFNVFCTSTKGEFTIEIHPGWAPVGAARFLKLVAEGAFDGTVIYRVVRRGSEPEAVEFGYLKDPELRVKWQAAHALIDDPQIFADPNFHRGMISFAGGGPDTRSTDVFITFMTWNDNGTPRAPWETPFGIIDEAGLKVIGQFGGTGDLGNMPDMSLGYEALKTSNPDIDYLRQCNLVHAAPASLGRDMFGNARPAIHGVLATEALDADTLWRTLLVGLWPSVGLIGLLCVYLCWAFRPARRRLRRIPK